MGTLAGGLLAPLAAQSQPAGKVYRIGWLSPASAANGLPNLDALRAGLRELGYVEGRNITIEARWADGEGARLSKLATELVALRVEVICTAGSPASLAAKQATATVPIVFANVAFPMNRASCQRAHPGGNVTGVAFIGPEYGKRLEPQGVKDEPRGAHHNPRTVEACSLSKRRGGGRRICA
jgi:putative ABC transport system substrate-binding protein